MKGDFGLVAMAAMTGSTLKYKINIKSKKRVPDEYYCEKMSSVNNF